jgi:uncharacterized protein (TIGR02246 family)
MIMKTVWILLTLLPLACAAAASKGSQQDEQAVRQAIAAYGNTENQREASSAGAAWTENAVYITEAGERVEGRDAIVKRLQEYKANNPANRVRLTVESIRFPADGVSQVDGNTEIRGPDGPPDVEPYVAVLVKRDGRWLLDSVHDLAPYSGDDDQPASERLKALEWMVGDWQEHGGGTAVECHCRWAKNNSFLLWDYTIKAGEQEAMTVTQRIGWDPQTGQFRSWIFDSEGGFAEGRWEKDEGAWTIQQSGVLPDGGTASAMALLAPDGKDAFDWTLTYRRVGGDKLADVHVRFNRTEGEARTEGKVATTRARNRRAKP